MSRIKQKADSIKKKFLEEKQNDVNTLNDNSDIPEKPKDGVALKQNVEKKKVTFYIALEYENKLNEIYAGKLMKGKKEDRSSLVSRAIDMLWKEEKSRDF